MKQLLSGNEGIARGAYEYGVRLASAYPGTPSTEIMEYVGERYPEIKAGWAPNEKVALEVAAGAAYGGARAMACMKHVGLNVAADPFMTLSYTGVNGGLVIVVCDDPEMHSSQNEQDTRNFAKFGKVPCLEPSDSQEAKDLVGEALKISEMFDTPVILRSSTRVSHSMSLVETQDRAEGPRELGLKKDPMKFVMLPAMARKRHPIVEQRQKDVASFADTFSYNRIIMNDDSLGIIAAGIAFQYAREALPNASFLKLGMSWPLPEKLIREFASKVKRLVVIEELDPIIEDAVKLMGIKVEGKELTGLCGELSPEKVEIALMGSSKAKSIGSIDIELPLRPPNMCPGCPHRATFTALKKNKVYVAGDIGCYTLGALPPVGMLDNCLCMGAGIGIAAGLDRSLGELAKGKAVAVIGDSTFFHSGMTPLLELAYNGGSTTVVILDNRTTAMTGAQPNPGTGFTLRADPTISADIEKLAEAFGFKRIRTVSPYNVKETEDTIREELQTDEPSLIIARAPCALLKTDRILPDKPLRIKADVCKGCKSCINTGCPALEFVKIEEPAEGDKRKGYSRINDALCVGCRTCQEVCKFDAIEEAS
ncbi:indolepyruvate ferredoxin oxidoreductase subunit alpha [Desulfomonile tiedjei]|uniref:Indolepyruvate oxidoreductase subunit IorA n=1 Tax=Desulfomonile tiedjei (strain ATCC 49306 / DSM 6799 / DCB-1) TaxID=706587 RepID=I4C8Q6_DESTA|nr:indolepyruvate ferredoxin oxidoreductase subunit alpha [Desulfomonile tiedjei]AFM25947.1 indolepyruvate ferredoxin oxidoreductase, alpha subunit [Desulfomonile tiedjei DSM 6799]